MSRNSKRTRAELSDPVAKSQDENRMRKHNWPGELSHPRLVTGIDPTTDEGRAKALFNGALECLVGAKKLDEGFPDLSGEYILTFHALELSLKYISGEQGDDGGRIALSPYGHNLQKLLDEAGRRGLSVSSPHARDYVEWLNVYHDKGSLLRYDFAHTRELPMCKAIFPIIEEISSASR